MLEKTLIRLINFLSGGKFDRIRGLHELDDGILLCKILQSMGYDVNYEDTKRPSNVTKVANITAVVFCLENEFKEAKINIDASSIVNGSIRGIVSLVWSFFYVLKVFECFILYFILMV